MKKKTSILWRIPKKELEIIVRQNSSLAGILRHFNLKNGNNFGTLKKRLIEDKIDYSHIPLGQNSNKGRKFPGKAIPLEKVMIENSTYSRGHLKKRLLKNDILKNECIRCGQSHTHYGEKLVMVLDHINGINNDHRLENLRMLCPNCNSQMPTFAGRSNKKHYYCEKCGKEKKWKYFKLCKKCAGFSRRKVKNRPSIKVLELEIKKLGYCGTGRKYGVSDSAIRKWIGIKI